MYARAVRNKAVPVKRGHFEVGSVGKSFSHPDNGPYPPTSTISSRSFRRVIIIGSMYQLPILESSQGWEGRLQYGRNGGTGRVAETEMSHGHQNVSLFFDLRSNTTKHPLALFRDVPAFPSIQTASGSQIMLVSSKIP